MIIFVLVALVCAGYLAWYYFSAPDNEETQEVLEQYKEEVPQQQPEAVEIPIDFDALDAVNPDVYAWITIEGTHIDYPVVQSAEDNEYYLDHNWEGESAAAGAIFTQIYNSKDFSDYNTVLYGHRMGNGNETMFYDLHNYMDMEYLKEHQEITVYTREHILTYKVFAAVVYDDSLIPLTYDFTQKTGRQEFLDSLYASEDVRNQFAEDVEVTADDRLLTLSTCLESEPHHRYLLGAVLTDEK